MLCATCSTWFAGVVAACVRGLEEHQPADLRRRARSGWATHVQRPTERRRTTAVYRRRWTCTLCAKLWLMMRALAAARGDPDGNGDDGANDPERDDLDVLIALGAHCIFEVDASNDAKHPGRLFGLTLTISRGGESGGGGAIDGFTFRAAADDDPADQDIVEEDAFEEYVLVQERDEWGDGGIGGANHGGGKATFSLQRMNADDGGGQDEEKLDKPEYSGLDGSGDHYGSAPATHLSPDRVAQIRRWMDAPASEHEKTRCVPPVRGSERFLPTRLVEILDEDAVAGSGSHDGAGADAGEVDGGGRIRIVQPEIIRHRTDVNVHRYATLSHCWGDEDVLKLTTANRAEFQAPRGVRVHRLSRTFAEAIALCRQLDIRFIWIDSLCIVQGGDGLADWRHEAPRMNLVYGGAHLNIAASASRRGSQGLFRPFRRRVVGRALAVLLADGRWLREAVPPAVEGLVAVDLDFAQAPLHRRAWVLQELALARRTLHFTDWQMVWQCKCSIFAESHPRTPLSEGVSWTFAFTPEDVETVDGLDRQWMLLATDYSRAHVTVRTDRNVALVGLSLAYQARYVDILYPDVPRTQALETNIYNFGCWQGGVHWLLWEATGGGLLGSAHDRSRVAPSWSWLSARSGVRFRQWFNNNDGMRMTTPVAVVSFEGDSEQLSRFIHIQAPYFRLDIFCGRNGFVPPDSGRLYGDCEVNAYFSNMCASFQNMAGELTVILDFRPAERELSLSLYGLCLQYYRSSNDLGLGSSPPYTRYEGILLDSACAKRVGIFSFHYEVGRSVPRILRPVVVSLSDDDEDPEDDGDQVVWKYFAALLEKLGGMGQQPTEFVVS